jgi:hypothetical protein
MKIGFSLGRCVRDIVNDEISITDVAFIITATNIYDTDQLSKIIAQYQYEKSYLDGINMEQAQAVALTLWNTNRLLQPRRQGLQRHMQPENAIWVDLYPTHLSENVALNTAWKNYRVMLHMIENMDNSALETFK